MLRRAAPCAALAAMLTLACGPAPGGTSPSPPPAPEFVAALFGATDPTGAVMWTPVPAATIPGSTPLVLAVPTAAVVLVFKTDASLYFVAGATVTSAGRQLAQATAGSITEIRRLREADEGFYLVDSTVKSPTDGILRWFVTFEPPTYWREGRVFHLDVSAVALVGYPGPATQVWLAFSPPTAPSGVTFSAYQTGARHRDITWTDNSSDETGFDIRVSSEMFLDGYVIAGRVAPDQTSFTTGDKDLVGNTRDDWYQVCARGSWPRRCSLPSLATYLPVRPEILPCTSMSSTVDITLTPLTEDPLLYRGFAPDPVTQPIAALPGAAGGLSTSLEDRSVLPFEVRGPEPGYLTLTSGGSVTYPKIEVEGPWTARLPSTTNPLPASLTLRIGYCR